MYIVERFFISASYFETVIKVCLSSHRNSQQTPSSKKPGLHLKKELVLV